MSDDSDVQVVLVAKDGDVGALGWRLAWIRLALHQIADGRRRSPAGLVQHAVERNRRGNQGDRRQRRRGIGARLLRRGDANEHQQQADEQERYEGFGAHECPNHNIGR